MTALRTVLLVDDEPAIRRCCSIILRNVAQIVSVGSCAEARVAIAQHTFDVALVDLVMPDEFGDVLLRELKVLSPRTKRVLLSASSHLVHEEDLFVVAIPKPFDPKALVEAVTQSSGG